MKILTRDGLDLHLVSEVAQAPRLTLVILHGYAEHGGRYAHVQAGLAEHGISSVVGDLRGHGRSSGRRGYVTRFDDYHHDVDALLEVARERAEGGPLALFGHSNGGLITAHYLLHRGDAGLCCAAITSPFFGLAQQLSSVKEYAARFLARVLPWSGLPTGLKGSDVTREPDIQHSYDNDPMVLRWANASWFQQARRAQDEVLQRAGELDLPLLVLYGGEDRVADPAATERFLDAALAGNVESERLDGLYHEVLNEPERREVIDRLAGWLVAHAASGS